MLRMNLEHRFRFDLPERCQHLGDQLVAHLKQLRDRCAAGDSEAAIAEFFETYRFDDSPAWDVRRGAGKAD